MQSSIFIGLIWQIDNIESKYPRNMLILKYFLAVLLVFYLFIFYVKTTLALMPEIRGGFKETLFSFCGRREWIEADC